MKKADEVVGTWLLIEFLYSAKRNRKYWSVKCINCNTVKKIEESNMKPPSGGKCQNCWGRPKGYAGLKELIGVYKRNSVKCDREFLLSEDQFFNLTSQKCHYCGCPPNNIFKGGSRSGWGDYTYNGIDRIDNCIGYVLHNCVTCCTICNRAKNKMSYKDFWVYIERIKLGD